MPRSLEHTFALLTQQGFSPADIHSAICNQVRRTTTYCWLAQLTHSAPAT